MTNQHNDDHWKENTVMNFDDELNDQIVFVIVIVVNKNG